MDKSKEDALTKKKQLQIAFKGVLKNMVSEIKFWDEKEQKIDVATNLLMKEVTIRTKVA